VKSFLIHGAFAIISLSPISLADEQEKIHPGRYEPDHLIPLRDNPADWNSPYMQALRPRLKLDATFFARVVIRPSFDGETCLRLHSNDGETDIAKPSKFFLTSYQADKSIWYAMPGNNDAGKQGEVTVEVSSAPVSGDFARRLRTIWDQMLSRTRPPEKPNSGTDGVTYEFSTPEHSGETWSPWENNAPRHFANLSHSLIRYCQAKPTDRAGAFKSVEFQVSAIEKYLKEHPVKQATPATPPKPESPADKPEI